MDDHQTNAGSLGSGRGGGSSQGEARTTIDERSTGRQGGSRSQRPHTSLITLTATGASQGGLDSPSSPVPELHIDPIPSSSSSTSPSSAAPAAAAGSNPTSGGLGALVGAFVSGIRSAVAGGSAVGGESAVEGNGQATTGPSDSGSTALTTSGDDLSSNTSTTGTTEASSATATTVAPIDPDVIQFRMPFPDPQGNPAILYFTPTEIPALPANAVFSPSPPMPQGSPPGQPHVPVQPIFVPVGMTSLPVSFLYDTITMTAWPIMAQTPGQPPGGLPGGVTGDTPPRLVSGRPFRISLGFRAPPPQEPERPDPEKARVFVEGLERADSELRTRMARLGMGDIGAYAMAGQGQGALGCGICLDEYETEDRPEWIAGEAARDHEVVCVPCPGHHTLHAACLRDWLANTKPSGWTCPFCRASLRTQPSPHSGGAGGTSGAGARRGANGRTEGSEANKEGMPDSAASAKSRTLREEIRWRERAHGWRCDAPACLPRYPPSDSLLPGQGAATIGEDQEHLAGGRASGLSPRRSWEEERQVAAGVEDDDAVSTETITLVPCRHSLHLDCLQTTMRVEDDLLTPTSECGEADTDVDADSVAQTEEDSEDEDEDEADRGSSEEEGPERGQNDGDERADRGAHPVMPAHTPMQLDEKHPIAIVTSTSPPAARPRKTKGRWVNCPACRKESWAEIPIRPKRRTKSVKQKRATRGEARHASVTATISNTAAPQDAATRADVAALRRDLESSQTLPERPAANSTQPAVLSGLDRPTASPRDDGTIETTPRLAKRGLHGSVEEHDASHFGGLASSTSTSNNATTMGGTNGGRKLNARERAMRRDRRMEQGLDPDSESESEEGAQAGVGGGTGSEELLRGARGTRDTLSRW